MIVTIINKVLVIVFFLACLNIIRHAYYLIQTSLQSSAEAPVKYVLSDKSLVLLGLSIAYVLSSVFIGIQL